MKRKSKLRQWGIEIETTEEKVRVVGVPGVLVKDIDGGRWKGILLEYVAASADECPTGLMDMFCSKACRSVCSMRMRNDSGNYCGCGG